MNISEIKTTINYLLDNNKALVEKGLDKIAVNIVGQAGIGKTAIIKEIAKERGAGYQRLNLSELEEVGDLVGVPQKEFMMVKDGEEKLVAEKLIPQFINLGYSLCPDCKPVMSYAIPAWVPQDPDQEFILYLDDFSRASQLFMQAIMSLIQFGEYISWKLPKNCHLILSSNPDNGDYSVTGLDAAQQSRMINFNVDFDLQVFAKWMSKVGIRSELQNFALLTPEIFTRGARINARSYTMFANAISGLKQFDTEDALATVCLIAKGCFDDEYVAGLFVQFVHNKLDKLIDPEKMLKGEWKDVEPILEENIYRNGKFDSAVSSTLTTRFTNYIESYFESISTDKKKSETVIDRIIDFANSPKTLITEDLFYRMVKTLNAKYPTRCQKMLQYPTIRMKLLS